MRLEKPLCSKWTSSSGHKFPSTKLLALCEPFFRLRASQLTNLNFLPSMELQSFALEHINLVLVWLSLFMCREKKKSRERAFLGHDSASHAIARIFLGRRLGGGRQDPLNYAHYFSHNSKKQYSRIFCWIWDAKSSISRPALGGIRE